MDQNLNESQNDPILAILCEDHNDGLYFTHLDPPIAFKDIKFYEDQLIVGNIVFNHYWFQSITVCTESVLKEFEERFSFLQ